MLKEIYNPNNGLPSVFNGITPVIKLKTKYIEQLIIEQPPMDSTEEPLLLVSMPQDGNTTIKTLYYSTADIITKKGLRDVVPVVMVLQDFNERLYLATTYIKFFAPDNEIPANQLKMFPDEKTN
jgi:hypothetical protein